MRSPPGMSHGRSVLLVSALATLVACASAHASDVIIGGLHCNDLCQSWMGYRRPEIGGAPTTPGVGRMHSRIPRRATVASAPAPVPHRPKVEEATSGRAAPARVRVRPHGPEVAASRRTPRPTREARKGSPAPSSRTASPVDPAVVASIPPAPAKPAPAEAPLRLVDPAVTPEAGPPTAALRRPTSPVAPGPSRGASDAAAPAPAPDAVPTRPAPHPSAPAASAPAASDPRRDADAAPTVPPPPSAAGGSERRESSEPQPPVPQPPVVASLPPPAGTDIAGHDGRPGGDTQNGDGRIRPGPVRRALPVSIGQIRTDPHGTDVHVVVVNVLRRGVDAVRVDCKARDARGQQVAEAASEIADIAPSDVGLGRVRFPPEITTRDNTFTCDSDTIGEATP